MFKFLNLHYLTLRLKENVSPSLMKIFGIFGIINFPLLYILGTSLLNEKPVALYLRSLGFCVCLPLALIDYWPLALKRYQNYYWFLALLYALPFFATYMFIENGASPAWQVKVTVGIFWLFLLTNWGQFLVLFPLGVISACLVFTCVSGAIPLRLTGVGGDLLNCGWALVVGAIFIRRKEMIQQLEQHKMQAGAIAHEMRTPLSTISLMAKSLKRHLPTLVHTQAITQQKDTEIPHIPLENLHALETIPDRLTRVSRNAFTVVDMLLMNLQEDVPQKLMEKCSILKCVEASLHDYPLSEADKNLIFIDVKEDFEFIGNFLMMKHVFFNLIKNALHYIKDAQKGEIRIWSELGEKTNKLYFEDTGKGISKKNLPYIFKQFFTQTTWGTGVGLAFCKMVMTKLGGNIECESIEGKYTRFILTFPVYLQKKHI